MNNHHIKADIHLRLDTFSLEIKFQSSSQALGVFGKSGSGKTSFLEIIAGIQKNASGNLEIGGTTWLDSKSGINKPIKERKFGYVPQDLLLFPHWNVLQNLDSAVFNTSSLNTDYQSLRSEIIEILDLSDLLERFPNQLSGGEKQRVALGRALCINPKLLLLDEPLASLDISLRNKILPYLLKIKETFEPSILIVSHNPTELLALCDEVIAIEAGNIIAQDTPSKLFSTPKVYPIAAREGFQNILTTALKSHSEDNSIIHLGKQSNSPSLVIPRIDERVGTRITVGIPSNDILVSTEKITNISARNCILATIKRVASLNNKFLIRAQVDNSEIDPLSIELTASAVKELKIEPGSKAWLIIKSNSIKVYR
ncbi:molybdenum ABC transporter ATP-binding protein [Puniceicoccaceae bacterium K14]|nr:molybdenum ABC transporter ATP-binding protein [Puniceicoccaceae bacterium K14]